MAYRFKIGGRIDKAFQRIGNEQLERCATLLSPGSDADPETAIHEARKSLKRLRALLRIVRKAIASDDFSRENERLRDIANLLSSARDAHVLAATLRQVADRANGDADIVAAVTAARGKIATISGSDTSREDIEAARLRLLEAQRALARVSVRRHGFEALSGGLQDTYRKARKAFGPGARTRNDEAWHEARKSVQTHWRHMALVMRVWPDAMLARVRMARRLSELLGEDHDLAMLRAFADENLTLEHACVIDTTVARRQEVLRGEAMALGAMLFAEKTEAFIARLAGYWEAAANLKRGASGSSDMRAAGDEQTRLAGGYLAAAREEPARRQRTDSGKAA